MQASVELAKLFLDSGTIVTFERNFPKGTIKFEADKASIFDRPLVVMVDEGSASASELFSGALQFNKRARLIGRKTYGKNSCQTFVPVSDDAGFYLTIGHFFLPDGRTIEGIGLSPDVVVDRSIGEKGLFSRAVQQLIHN
jgi:carboxyl-terminal processing protease